MNPIKKLLLPILAMTLLSSCSTSTKKLKSDPTLEPDRIATIQEKIAVIEQEEKPTCDEVLDSCVVVVEKYREAVNEQQKTISKQDEVIEAQDKQVIAVDEQRKTFTLISIVEGALLLLLVIF